MFVDSIEHIRKELDLIEERIVKLNFHIEITRKQLQPLIDGGMVIVYTVYTNYISNNYIFS